MINKKVQDALASIPSSFIFLQEAPDLVDIASSARTKQELVNAGIALIVGIISIMLKDFSKMLLKKRSNKRNNGRNQTNV